MRERPAKAGSSCIMARRLERSGHPTGFGPDTFNAVPGRFIDDLGELSFNTWLMDLPK